MPAWAQQTQPPATVDTVQPAEQAPQEDKGDVVTITGSRLSSQFTSASPMDVIVADEASAKGISDVASLLRSSTVAAGSPQITAVTSTAFVQDGGIGAEAISLRGLRATAAGSAGWSTRRPGRDARIGGRVRLQRAALSAVERVEVLKDGASSIYGSDAVAGVINVITKKGDGLDFDVFGSMPEHGGAKNSESTDPGARRSTTTSISASPPTTSNRKSSRAAAFFSCGSPYVFRDDGSRADLVDPRTGQYTCSNDLLWGHIWFYDYTQAGAVTRPWQARPQLIQYNYGNNLQNYLPGGAPPARAGRSRQVGSPSAMARLPAPTAPDACLWSARQDV